MITFADNVVIKVQNKKEKKKKNTENEKIRKQLASKWVENFRFLPNLFILCHTSYSYYMYIEPRTNIIMRYALLYIIIIMSVVSTTICMGFVHFKLNARDHALPFV